MKKSFVVSLMLLTLLSSTVVLASGPLTRLEAGDDLEYRLNLALALAVPGQTIELPDGKYIFNDEITIQQAGVRLIGQGPDRTILDFSKQKAGANAILGESNGLVFENFTVKDSPGDAIKVVGANGVTFRKLKIEWTKKADKKNGAYGFYPVLSRNILIEDCEVIGASDSGVYVGQSENIIVRRVYAHGNVAGIEIENSRYADVYDNKVTGNTAGILVFDLPDLPKQGGRQTRVFANHIYDNNLKNFSTKGNILNLVPPGVGIIVLANDDTEIFSNKIEKHRLVAISIHHFGITERPTTDPNYDSRPERIYVHDNIIKKSVIKWIDTNKLKIVFHLLFSGNVPDLTYDGIEDGTYSGSPLPEDQRVCFQHNKYIDSSSVSFGNLHLDNQQKLLPWPGGPISRDLSSHDCSHSPIPAVVLEPPLPLPAPKPTPSPEEVLRSCKSEGKGINWDAIEFDCPLLSDYRLFENPQDPTKKAKEGGLPYDLSTALFTDYAHKHRFIFFPPGTKAIYDPTNVFSFPKGTIISKTFSYPNQIIETRILIHRSSGWVALPYQWNTNSGSADLNLAGAVKQIVWTDEKGETQTVSYQIPGQSKCLTCHSSYNTVLPIGPKAAFLNRPFAYSESIGLKNQLSYWSEIGVLEKLPSDPTEIPQAPIWNDPASGTLENRAKAYLDINCAHCHNPVGKARNTGLFLEYYRDAHTRAYGRCKAPVAAGAGTGGRMYDIVPGSADESILTYRIRALEPAVRMPQIGRTLVHVEGATLIEDWIDSLDKEKCED